MAIGAAIGSIAGGLIQGSAASKASKAQQRAADQQIALQREIYDDTVGRMRPFYEGGLSANDALLYEMGLGPLPTVGATPLDIETIPGSPAVVQQPSLGDRGPQTGFAATHRSAGQAGPETYRVGGRTFTSMDEARRYAEANATGGTPYAGYTATPAFQNALKVGTEQIDRTAAARGNVLSGATIKAQTQFANDLAMEDYSNYLARLAGLAGSGQNAAGNLASVGQNFAAGASNALGSRGDAAAAGAIGVGNALNAGIGNVIGAWQYGDLIKKYQPNALTSGVY